MVILYKINILSKSLYFSHRTYIFLQLPPKIFLVVVRELLGSKRSTNKTDKVLISHSSFSDLEQDQVTIDKLLEHKYFL